MGLGGRDRDGRGRRARRRCHVAEFFRGVGDSVPPGEAASPNWVTVSVAMVHLGRPVATVAARSTDLWIMSCRLPYGMSYILCMWFLRLTIQYKKNNGFQSCVQLMILWFQDMSHSTEAAGSLLGKKTFIINLWIRNNSCMVRETITKLQKLRWYNCV